MKNELLVNEYAEQIKPLLSLAQRAYGAKTQDTPAHVASRKYTQLLLEYSAKDGNLGDLAHVLGVAYSGIRRRVIDARAPLAEAPAVRRKYDQETFDAALDRVREAKKMGPRSYHKQLSIEYYDNGISLGAIAKGLGISNAAPLYYGIQRHATRVAQQS
jgi:hypothetical protein